MTTQAQEARVVAPKRITFMVGGHPVPAVRMTRGAVHVANHPNRKRIDRHLAWRDTVAQCAREAVERIGWPFNEAGPLYQDARLYGTVVFWVYKHYGADIENWQKLVIDGCQGIVFKNDNQFDDLRSRRIYIPRDPDEDAYVDITIGVMP